MRRRMHHMNPLVMRMMSTRTIRSHGAALCQTAIDHLSEAIHYFNHAEAIEQDEKRTPIDAALYAMMMERAEAAKAKGLHIAHGPVLEWWEERLKAKEGGQ